MKRCFAPILLLATLLVSCGEAPEPVRQDLRDRVADAEEASAQGQAPPPRSAPEPIDLVERGRVVYQINCIACHNPDPAQIGSLGPEITSSSRDLLEKRIIYGEYPEGYTPKRDSTLMIPLPHLETELDALTAYLNQ